MPGAVDSGSLGPADGSRGRRPSTTRAHVAQVALDLFARQGFDATTVDQIAAAVGISRRTFFRYFESKSDAVWGEFDAELVRLASQLDLARPDEPMIAVVRRAVVATNRFGAGELDALRIRIGLISTVPTLVAHSAVRYAQWCDVVAGFAGRRMERSPDSVGPQTVARASLGAAMAAFASWSLDRGLDLASEVERAFRVLETGFDDDRLRRLLGAPDHPGRAARTDHRGRA